MTIGDLAAFGPHFEMPEPKLFVDHVNEGCNFRPLGTWYFDFKLG